VLTGRLALNCWEGKESSTVAVADYAASNDWLVMNWKNCVGKWPWSTSSFVLAFV
jgi:hypothetical protein